MRAKVCGLNSVAQMMALDEMGVEFAGFIFYPKSPRYILKQVAKEALKKAKGQHINKVGVFVNEQQDEVIRMVDECGLYLVQLHGDETPRYCEKIADYVTVIKAFRLRNDDDVLWKIKDYQNVVDMFLFDTAALDYGGTGKQFDWNILRNLNINKPFFLSGGIGPDDIESLTAFSKDTVAKNLFSVDINSRFESSPGVKNMDLVKPFIQQLKLI
ncbi:MAG: phosphoribosylanthranilate isomerase [Sphingobacteriia bacterium]|jgi:phosphoribosylanthranilate isomerase|nr:MAG: phosphoribosylanthranilate isomerase [Sphingobacteriia bacterium]TAG30419.1 MAG: phosphoribosylanthranilate isomerase [Sphingobacteriia bacterium]TAH06500.1 MAG: phosphoribosylanthranilate isomerase [Sphingobacteriia bacterium]